MRKRGLNLTYINFFLLIFLGCAPNYVLDTFSITMILLKEIERKSNDFYLKNTVFSFLIQDSQL